MFMPHSFQMFSGGVPDDYLAFYPMDGTDVSGSTLQDQSGNGYDGTINGATQVSDYLSFDGTNDRINGITPFLANLTSFTFSVDVYFDAAASADYDIFVHHGHLSGEGFFFWYDTAATDHYAIWVEDNNDDNAGALLSSAVPVTGSWQKLLVTFDGGNEVRLFINGTEDANSPWSIPNVGDIDATKSSLINASAAFGYNNATTSDGKYLDGRLRKARFYDRVLSASEINAIASE